MMPIESAEKCAKAIVNSACRRDEYLAEPHWIRTTFYLKTFWPGVNRVVQPLEDILARDNSMVQPLVRNDSTGGSTAGSTWQENIGPNRIEEASVSRFCTIPGAQS
ncbi:hypothetical protein LguiB_008056 [Lonicera macranthoides]